MKNAWNIINRTNPGDGDRQAEALELHWFLEGDHISDDFTPDEADARELFKRWLRKVNTDGDLKVSWMVMGVGELAPFTDEGTDFLTYYGWPVHAETGERLNWLTLPVQDKGWRVGKGDKGGFIQEVTGWTPSALQRSVHMPTLLKACGWN